MNLSTLTIKGVLVQQIRDEIICGNFAPGTRLRLRDLAEQFNVSTQPIREALSELETEGLVKTEPRKGAVVTALTPAELLDIYEVRATLEAMATRLAVKNVSADTLKALQALISDMDNRMGDVVELVKLNKRFHLSLYESSNRPHLCTLIGTLRNHTAHYLHAYMIHLGGMPPAQDDHRALVAACREGDVNTAEALMYDHVMAAGKGIIEYVSEQKSI